VAWWRYLSQCIHQEREWSVSYSGTVDGIWVSGFDAEPLRQDTRLSLADADRYQSGLWSLSIRKKFILTSETSCVTGESNRIRFQGFFVSLRDRRQRVRLMTIRKQAATACLTIKQVEWGDLVAPTIIGRVYEKSDYWR